MQNDKLDKLNAARFGGEMHRRQVRAQYDAKTHPSQRREPPVTRETLIDLKIKQAEMEGQFKNLPGQGQPFDLSAYADTPEHLRTAYHMLKSSGFLPEEVRLKRDMEEIKEHLQQCHDPEEKKRLLHELSEVSQKYHMCMEYNNGFKKRVY
ncbi:MAG: DUF1992 domain-containing protein [Deltaproteobacteria bacterium]|nr:DUF1992 domain-containing protein [Deltaproteobacteria bacterium]